MRVHPAAALAAILVVTSLAAPAGAQDDDVARFAVVLGYNGGDAEGPRAATGAPNRPRLTFADDDAARFFLQVYRGSERAWLLTTFDNESARGFPALADQAAQPTRRELARVLGEASWLIRRAQKEGRKTELVFFFAGHGDVTAGGEGFVVLADGPFTKSDLATQVIEGSPADLNHIVLDACASYFMVPRGGGDDEQGTAGRPGDSAHRSVRVPVGAALIDAVRSTDRAALERTGFLVSTSTAAEVHESAEVGGGVFSYLLRSAVAGGADANGDGKVEYSEAAGFIGAASEDIQDPRARLSIHARPPAQRPHAPLYDLRQSGLEHFLVVDDEGEARIRVLDSRGVPYAELHRTPDGPRLLALAGHPFFIVQRDGLRGVVQEAVLVPRSAGAYALSSLSFEDAPSARGPSAVGPFQGLFDVAFGDAFLRGFLAKAELLPPRAGKHLSVAWAEGGEPPFRMPWWTLAGSSFAGAGVLAAGAALAALGNLASFIALQQVYLTTGTVDPRYSLLTDAWLTGAGILAVGAVGAVALGGGLTFLALRSENE